MMNFLWVVPKKHWWEFGVCSILFCPSAAIYIPDCVVLRVRQTCLMRILPTWFEAIDQLTQLVKLLVSI